MSLNGNSGDTTNDYLYGRGARLGELLTPDVGLLGLGMVYCTLSGQPQPGSDISAGNGPNDETLPQRR
jgi:hypothetical protein